MDFIQLLTLAGWASYGWVVWHFYRKRPPGLTLGGLSIALASAFIGLMLRPFGMFMAILLIWLLMERKVGLLTGLFAPRDPVKRELRDLQLIERRDPYRLTATYHGAARFAWIQHFLRQVQGIYMYNTITTNTERMKENSLPYWQGYYLCHMERDLRFAGDGHRLIVGPPGSGKFYSSLGLLLCDGYSLNTSMIVFDPKDGELTRRCAGRRSQQSYLAVLDPYGITGLPPYRFNPLDTLRSDDPMLVERVEDIREALIITSDDTKNASFWDTHARRWLDAVILHVATCPRETERTLMRVAEIASLGIPVDVLAAMQINRAGEGLVSRYACEVEEMKLGMDTKLWLDICATVQKSLYWLNTPALRRSLERSDFNIGELIYGQLYSGTLFVALPEKARSNAMAWMRVVYASLINSLREYSPNPQRHVHIVIDEFANLGRLEKVKNDLATTRARNWHYHLAVQSLAQLRDVYGETWEQLIGQCAIEQLLGCGDNFTADYYSKAAGQTTVDYTTTSTTLSQSSTRQIDGTLFGQSSAQKGTSTSTAQHFQGVPLLDLATLRSNPHDLQYIFSQHCPPIRAAKLHMAEVPAIAELLNLPVNPGAWRPLTQDVRKFPITPAPAIGAAPLVPGEPVVQVRVAR